MIMESVVFPKYKIKKSCHPHTDGSCCHGKSSESDFGKPGRWIIPFVDLSKVLESPYLNNQCASATLLGIAGYLFIRLAEPFSAAGHGSLDPHPLKSTSYANLRSVG